MVLSLRLSQFALALTAAASFLSVSQPAVAQEVVLKGKDSPLNITGTLLSTSGGRFLVRTAIGEFEIEQSLVTCEGAACPQERNVEYDLRLVGEGEVAGVLLPIIAEGFAATLDAETVLVDTNGAPIDADRIMDEFTEADQLDIEIIDYEGEEVANLGIIRAEGIPAYELMVSGEGPILFSDTRATRRERDLIEEAGLGDLRSYEQDHVIAVEGFAVVVNPKNAINGVTIEQVAGVFSGIITDWAQLGGEAGPINLYSFDSDSETFNTISELLLEPFDYALSPEANIVRNSGELSAAITRDESGFGVISYHSRRGTRALPLTNECGMTFYVSPFNIKTEEYPLGHRVHAYNRPDVEGYARDFLAYIDGPDLDGLVSKAGFVDLSVVSEIQVDAAERVALAASESADPYERGYMETLMQSQSEYERLSTTFRFAPGSNELDAKSRRDLARMLRYLNERQPEEVLAVGFTDNKGTFDANILVSEQRAEEVIRQIQNASEENELDNITFTAMGFGELSPAACNSTPQGRRTNRRVEMWVK